MIKQNKYEKLFDCLLKTIEFRLLKYPTGWGLLDDQGANWGDIESDRFNTAKEVCDRLDIYITDYFADHIKEAMSDGKYSDWGEMIEAAKGCLGQEYSFSLKVLDMVIHHTDEVDLSHCHSEDSDKVVICMYG